MKDLSKKRHLRDIGKFLDIIAKFKSVGSAAILADTIVKVCDELIPSDSVGCYLVDPERPHEGIKLLAHKGFEDDEILWANKSASHRHPGMVMKSKKSILIKDTEDDKLSDISTTSPRRMNIRSRAWVPILLGKQAIGSFGIASSKAHNFNENDIELLELVSYLSQVTYDVLLRSQRYHKEKERTNEQIKDRSTFFAFINHEIRNPINAILGFSEILKDEDLSDRQKRYIANIHKAGNNLLRLTNDLSDLSKLSADKMELQEGDLNLRDMVEEIIDLYSLDASQKNITFSYFISEDADCIFRGDTDRLKQVISNLISNSIKFTNEGEISITVSATHDFHTKSKIHVDIFDTGIGIKEEDIAKLFREYSQIHDSKKKTVKGTGLGLNISQKLVALMGGNIHVRSDYNIGTNFSFNIFLEKMKRLETKNHLSVFKKSLIISSTKFLSNNLKSYLKNYGIRTERVYGLDFVLEPKITNSSEILIFVDQQSLDVCLDTALTKLNNFQNIYPKAKYILLSEAYDKEFLKVVEAYFDNTISKSFKQLELDSLLMTLAKKEHSHSNRDPAFELVRREQISRRRESEAAINLMDIPSKIHSEIFIRQLHIFKQKSLRHLVQLKKSYINLDKNESLKYSLALAGESSAINATSILEKCIRIETLITREQWDTVGQLLERMDEELKLLVIEIDKHPLERPIVEESIKAS